MPLGICIGLALFGLMFYLSNLDNTNMQARARALALACLFIGLGGTVGILSGV